MFLSLRWSHVDIEFVFFFCLLYSDATEFNTSTKLIVIAIVMNRKSRKKSRKKRISKGFNKPRQKKMQKKIDHFLFLSLCLFLFLYLILMCFFLLKYQIFFHCFGHVQCTRNPLPLSLSSTCLIPTGSISDQFPVPSFPLFVCPLYLSYSVFFYMIFSHIPFFAPTTYLTYLPLAP